MGAAGQAVPVACQSGRTVEVAPGYSLSPTLAYTPARERMIGVPLAPATRGQPRSLKNSPATSLTR